MPKSRLTEHLAENPTERLAARNARNSITNNF